MRFKIHKHTSYITNKLHYNSKFQSVPSSLSTDNAKLRDTVMNLYPAKYAEQTADKYSSPFLCSKTSRNASDSTPLNKSNAVLLRRQNII